MADKSNALRFGHDLWLRTFAEVAAEYPEIENNHMYIDAMAMALIRDPSAFDVIVTCNLFGDIITDLGAQLQGGMGMAGSGNINPDGTSMFEPVHGSAPDIVGKDVANPFAAILTVAMMLEHCGEAAASNRVEQAVRDCLAAKESTVEVGGSLGTKATGDAVARRVRKGE
jgi:3-isopropylmalate dehydrogenase